MRIAIIALTLTARPALAGAGFDWAVIGDPGNAGIFRDAGFDDDRIDREIGSVGYTYRMSKTELTWGQWAEFVTAYRPYWSGDPNSVRLTGGPVSTSDGGASYQVLPGYENVAATPSWGLGALYANWLHNGKRSDASAFAYGAYDTSDWVWKDNNPSAVIAGNFNRLETARYWIPSEDEWVKAAYYDPNRHGAGQPGYWLHPNQSDDPAGIDQTSSAVEIIPPLPVGSFPDVTSPWGLLDVSGGVREWTGDWFSADPPAILTVFVAKGSEAGDLAWEAFDPLLARPWIQDGNSSFAGIRLAAQVPAPASPLIGMALGACVLARPRRR